MPPVEERLATIETVQRQHTDLLREIRDQAKLTNGRIGSLERWKARADGAKAAMDWLKPLLIAVVSGGAVAAVTALLS